MLLRCTLRRDNWPCCPPRTPTTNWGYRRCPFVPQRHARPPPIFWPSGYCANPRAIPDPAVLDFIAAAGSETTLGLLQKGTRRYGYEDAAAEIRLRLALPEKRTAARARDAMLFWQAVHCAPGRGVIGPEYATEAAILSKHKLSVSPEYLIEQLEHPRMDEQAGHFYADQGRTNMAIEIVAHQKENSAVSALATLVRSSPEFRERVEHALKTIGTPEATKVLKELSAGAKEAPAPNLGRKADKSKYLQDKAARRSRAVRSPWGARFGVCGGGRNDLQQQVAGRLSACRAARFQWDLRHFGPAIAGRDARDRLGRRRVLGDGKGEGTEKGTGPILRR